MAGEAFTDLSDLISICTGSVGEIVPFYKNGLQNGGAITAPVAGKMSSMWRWDGAPGGASQTAPTTAVVTTNSTAGALKQSTPASGAKKRFLGITAQAIIPGTIILYDRLVHHGGMSGTSVSAQTTNLPSGSTPALTRHTNGLGVSIWLEIYSQIGTSLGNPVISYTDENNNPATTPVLPFGTADERESDRIVPVALASGGRGVKSVQSVQLGQSTGTVGDFGITLAYPLATIPIPFSGGATFWSAFFAAGGGLDLGTDSDACLAFAWFAQTTSSPLFHGQVAFAEK